MAISQFIKLQKNIEVRRQKLNNCKAIITYLDDKFGLTELNIGLIVNSRETTKFF